MGHPPLPLRYFVVACILGSVNLTRYVAIVEGGAPDGLAGFLYSGYLEKHKLLCRSLPIIVVNHK